MDIITIDGMVEHDFRLSIEDMLRLDQVDEAVERLCELVAPFSGPSAVLPPCFLEAATRATDIGGWHRLGERLCDHDRKGRPITAIGVTLADVTKLGGPGPSRGRLAPFIKTFYFTDDAFPFSNATRDDLLDGYSRDGFEWQGDYQATDGTLSIKGLDDLYGPIFALEKQLLARPDPDEEEIRAGTIGACLVAVLVHRALRDAIRANGLPRPLGVISACDGVYPYFDAPVAGIEAYVAPAGVIGEDSDAALAGADDGEEDGEDPIALEGSLLNLISRRHDKAAVMTLCPEDAEEAHRFEEMAAASRLDATSEHAPAGALDLSQPIDPDDVVTIGDDDGFAREFAPAAEVDELPVPSGDEWRETGAAAGEGAEDGSDGPRHAFEPTVAPPECPPPRDDPPEGNPALEPEAEFAAEPPPPPASHSLRARIAVARPDERARGPNRIVAVLAWARRVLLSR